jgi:DNA-directed RNA polymerase alpha subunit
LSNRWLHCLINENLRTIGDILNYGTERLAMIRGCGLKCEQEIKDAIQKAKNT